jgi:hypothetical protein
MSVLTQIISSGEHHGVGAFTILQFCHWAGISKAQYYLEVNQGHICPRKVGRRSIIPVLEAVRWMDGLPTSMK